MNLISIRVPCEHVVNWIISDDNSVYYMVILYLYHTFEKEYISCDPIGWYCSPFMDFNDFIFFFIFMQY